MADVFFILVEGLADWPHPVPVEYWAGSETTTRLLSNGLQTEFREEAPSLKFSYVSPKTPEDLQAMVSRLAGAQDEGEFGEQVQAVCRAAARHKAFLEGVSPKSKGNGGAVAAASPAAPPAPNPPLTTTEPVSSVNSQAAVDETEQGEEPIEQPPVEPARPADVTGHLPDVQIPNDDQPLFRLLRVFTNGLADERFNKAASVLQDSKLTVHEKLTEIDRLIPFPATASAEQLGQLIGVSKQAVLKTVWWTQHRKGELVGQARARGPLSPAATAGRADHRGGR